MRGLRYSCKGAAVHEEVAQRRLSLIKACLRFVAYQIAIRAFKALNGRADKLSVEARSGHC